ncbi:MAG: hypothetical protein IJP19_01485 [Clostridia bacterium]|nr:hypothetical protein [Clostridia bacterium]
MSYYPFRQIVDLGDDFTIKSGETVSFKFSADKEDTVNKAHRLQFRGESGMFYFYNSEPDCSSIYMSIEDCLNKEMSQKDNYCLDLSSEEKVIYPKSVLHKLNWVPVMSYCRIGVFYDENWKFGISAKAKKLKIHEGGYVRFTAEVYYHGERNQDDLSPVPHETHTINIPEGTFDWTEFSKNITVPEKEVKYMNFYLEAYNYSGELYFERPLMYIDAYGNMLPDFAQILPNHDKWSWISNNLSKKEWPKFLIKANGKKVFDGELFERCHRFSEFEIDLPEKSLKPGKNTIEITLSEKHPVSMRIKDIGYYVKDAKDLVILACPETAYIGRKNAILIRTEKTDTTVVPKCDEQVILAHPQTFKESGLNIFIFEALKPVTNAELTLNGEKCIVERVIEKQDDGVITGSGDMIYINHESTQDMDDYLTWYMSEHVGNLLTIRNVYRWGGGRRVDEKIWNTFANRLDKLGVKYPEIVDGRDFQGSHCNPKAETIKTKSFLGRQNHEHDGQYGYWGPRDFTQNPIAKLRNEFWGILSRTDYELLDVRNNYSNYIEKDGAVYLYKLPSTTDDMEEAAKTYVENLRKSKHTTTRHTGPTTHFKYFFQAGYDWSGAELMDGPQDPLGAANRGAAYCYDKPVFGSHLAVQWSTYPHNTEGKKRRHRLAVYTSYTNGYTEINTEEGFWHMEEHYTYHSRNDIACKNLLANQQDFYRYVSLNTRAGKFYTPFAFISGKYDGWECFFPYSTFGHMNMPEDAPEKSWDLLKNFYPMTHVGHIGCKPCTDDKPLGFYTGTPRGNVDIVPIEFTKEKLQKYKTLSFAGFNKMEPEDSEKILQYVKDGGTLIIGWPHLSVTTRRDDVLALNHKYLDCELADIIAKDKNDFVKSTYNGKDVIVNKGLSVDFETLVSTDDGLPLLAKKQVENGALVFVNCKEYPYDNVAAEIFDNAICMCSDSNNSKENMFVSCNNNVNFTMYQRDDGTMDTYLIATDWYNYEDVNRKATLLLNGASFDLEIPFGTMVKVVSKDNVAAWIVSEDAVVTDVNNNVISVVGSGTHTLYVAKDGVLTTKDIDLTKVSQIKVEM